MNAIETRQLTKLYGNKVGCREITLAVPRGEIFGFLGPNGAGKSTFVKMLTGLLFPTSGSAYILGRPVGDVDTRKKIGYLPELFRYQEWMTGADLLSFHASLYKMDRKTAAGRIEEVLDMVRLKGNERYKVGTYSKGMQQRLGFASALLADPDVLFLDEPSSALDPVGRKEVRELMVQLKRQGKTVFLNSHLLSEVETICDSIAIIKKGHVIRAGKLEELLDGRMRLDIKAENITSDALEQLYRLDPQLSLQGGVITLTIASRKEIPDIATMLVKRGACLYELTPHKESLENLFIRLMEGGEAK